MVLGHCLTPWLRLHGGKGVATGLGVLFGIAWPIALACCAVWLAVAALTRISSAAAIAVCIAAPLLALASGADPAPVALIAAWIVLRHHANIARLRAGTEPRIGR